MKTITCAFGVFFAIMLAAPSLARAQVCPNPEDLCECLATAGTFTVVADSISAKPGKQSYSGSSYVVPSILDGSVCATYGKLSGSADGETSVGQDLLFLASSGVAAKFKGYKVAGVLEPGTTVAGDLATKGGTIEGGDAVQVIGTKTTDGSNAELNPCQQAKTDAQNASNVLKALTPTQADLGKVVVAADTEQTITAGSGVSVINATSITLKKRSYSGSPIPSSLHIEFALDTDAVIINVSDKVSVADACTIDVLGGDPAAVIINVHGENAKLKVGREASVEPAILAPTAKIKASMNATVANLYGASVSVGGAEVSDTLLCGP